MRIFPETYAVGAQFGVVLVPLEAGTQNASARAAGVHDASPDSVTADHPDYVEVATFRNDGSYTDGRHPDQVRFPTTRRKTCSAATSPSTACCSIPLPMTTSARFRRRPRRPGGRHHPRHRRSRAPLRRRQAAHAARGALCRALRLHHRARDFRRDPAARAAQIRPGLPRTRARRADQDADRRPRAPRPFELLDESGLLHEVLPEIATHERRRTAAAVPSRGRRLGSTRCCCWKNCPPHCSRTLAWGALLHDVGKPPTFRVAPDRIRFDGHVEIGVQMAEEICRRLRFSQRRHRADSRAVDQSHALRRRAHE